MKVIPEFNDQAEEFESWSSADSTEYFDWPQAERVRFAGLKATQPPVRVADPRDQDEELRCAFPD